MKTLRDYIAETESWIADPVAGDEFDIELAPDSLFETYVVETVEDGVVLHADDAAMAVLAQHGIVLEDVKSYGPVGYGGVGQTFFEKDCLEEGIMDRLRNIYMELVYDTPMGTPDSEFINHWQRIIKNQLGKDIDQDTLYKLQQNFRERSRRMAQRGDHRDWHREMGMRESGVQEGGKRHRMSQHATGIAIRQAEDRRIAHNKKIYAMMRDIATKDMRPEDKAAAIDALQQQVIREQGVSEGYPYGQHKPKKGECPECGTVGGHEDDCSRFVGSRDWESEDDEWDPMWDPAEIERSRKAAQRRQKKVRVPESRADSRNPPQKTDYVRESNRILELAGVADHEYNKKDAVYHEDQSAGVLAQKELATDITNPMPGVHEDDMGEAKYQGREVKLGKPFLTPGGPKKRAVYVKNPKGNVVKVSFGDPNMRIKKSDPARRKSFRARHRCENPGPRHKARFWSCRAW